MNTKMNFKELTDEKNWIFDKNNVLKSIVVFRDGKEIDVPVIWDKVGAYVLEDNEKTYVLENIG